MRTPFAVGRLDRATRQVTWVRARPQRRSDAPFPGPWPLATRVTTAEAPANPASQVPARQPVADPPPADGEQLRLL